MKLIANMRLSHDDKIIEEGQAFEVEDKRAQMILADPRNLVKKAKESAKKDDAKKASKK